jgi:hypothetical protein
MTGRLRQLGELLMIGAKMLVKSDQNLLRLEGEQLALRKELRELAVAPARA